MTDKTNKYKYIGKGLASLAICVAGTVAMYISNGQTGIGWAVLGLFIIWAIYP